MALPWVKLHTGLIDNDAFRLLSCDARLTFFTALAIAGKQDQGGALYIRSIGPMSEAQISGYTGLPVARQKKALEELASIAQFMMFHEGTWAISRWDEKAGDHSRARVSRYRQNQSSNGAVTLQRGSRNDDVTLQGQKCNGAEEDKERDKDQEKEKEVEAAASRPRMVRPTLPQTAPDAFGAAEADVAIFVAAAAAENKTGAISTGRIESIRRELLATREEFPEAFLAALREANARGKPSVNYVRAICKGRAKAPLLVVRPETIIDEALPDYLLDAIEQHDKDFGVAS